MTPYRGEVYILSSEEIDKIVDEMHQMCAAADNVQNYKVVGFDMWDRETEPDILFQDGLTKLSATELAKKLNDRGFNKSYFYKAKPADYQLKTYADIYGSQ